MTKESKMDRKIEKKRWTPKKIAQISLLGLVIVVAGYSFILGDRSSKLNVDLERVSISTVRWGQFQEFIPVTGAIIPIKTIYLDAPEGGRVDSIYIEAGSYVNKGDRILKLVNTNLLLDIMYREAELFQQSNNLRNTRLAIEKNRLALRAQLMELDYQVKDMKRIYERDATLVEKELIAPHKFEEGRDKYEYLVNKRDLTLESHNQDSIFREIQIKQLESSLKRMQVNLEIVKRNMENLVIKAPVKGQLTSLNAELGESKGRGQRLGQIDVLDGFKVRINIDEHYITRINIGQEGEFTLAGKDYGLIIQKVYPEVINGRFQVDMIFQGEEPEGIRRGQTLRIRLELGDLSEAILLARGGFFQRTGGQWVYVLDNNEEFAIKREIRLGRQNPDVFEVIEGLEPGEQVITSSYDNYGDIDKLILKRSSSS